MTGNLALAISQFADAAREWRTASCVAHHEARRLGLEAAPRVREILDIDEARQPNGASLAALLRSDSRHYAENAKSCASLARKLAKRLAGAR